MMYVTNTLSDPHEEAGWIPQMLAPLANQRKDANRIMREEPITVVLGNPPYKEKAKGKGSWVESGAKNVKAPAPLAAWMPPREWGVGTHSKHLRNLYIYFWRWATWKVFDHGDGKKQGPHDGIVCFITMAGFLNGPGFEKMRSYLRETCDDIWVIDCSPEGFRPKVNTRIFQGVKQPICIVLVSRSAKKVTGTASTVRFQALPKGTRDKKFAALGKIKLESKDWATCPSSPRAPFLPESQGSWAAFPKLEALFNYNGSGVMPGRTWIISPDVQSLEKRWKKLLASAADEKRNLFQAHLRNGEAGDKHADKIVSKPLAGHPVRTKPVSLETHPVETPERYAFRSFDREWIIPDSRLINQPNPELWDQHSSKQIFITALSRTTPSSGPAITFTGLIPDLDHFNGRGGRVFPLWADRAATKSNLQQGVEEFLSKRYGFPVLAEDVLAYIAAVVANPDYTARFALDLSTPGLRVPLTTDGELFKEAAELGRHIVWLHTFGERMVDPKDGRPAQPPRLPSDRRPFAPKDGIIPEEPESMPDTLSYDPSTKRLHVGQGHFDHVTPAMWSYEVSGKQILLQWFSYRKKDRERPVMGDRRAPSALGKIQADHWLPEYTTELLNVLNVLGSLIDLEPVQKSLLERVCASKLVSSAELAAVSVKQAITSTKKSTKRKKKDLPQLQFSES